MYACQGRLLTSGYNACLHGQSLSADTSAIVLLDVPRGLPIGTVYLFANMFMEHQTYSKPGFFVQCTTAIVQVASQDRPWAAEDVAE